MSESQVSKTIRVEPYDRGAAPFGENGGCSRVERGRVFWRFPSKIE